MIGVLVVTYNQVDETLRFVRNFTNLYNSNSIKLLVLDNNSRDKTYFQIISNFPNVWCEKLNDNYGCVTGRNIGVIELIRAGCKYIYITDNDIEFTDENFFLKLEKFMEINKDIDACCPIVRWADDFTIQTLGFKINSYGKKVNSVSLHSDKKIDVIPGCAQFIRAKTFKKFGLYDNDLSPISIEDHEWSIRLRSLGAKFLWCPDCEVLHRHDRANVTSNEKLKFVIIGRVVFLRKYFSFYFFLVECLHFIKFLKIMPFNYLIKYYYKGFMKKTIRDNYVYNIFLSSYYKNNFFS